MKAEDVRVGEMLLKACETFCSRFEGAGMEGTNYCCDGCILQEFMCFLNGGMTLKEWAGMGEQEEQG